MIEGVKNLRDFLLSFSPILYHERSNSVTNITAVNYLIHLLSEQSIADSLKPLSCFLKRSGGFNVTDFARLQRAGLTIFTNSLHLCLMVADSIFFEPLRGFDGGFSLLYRGFDPAELRIPA